MPEVGVPRLQTIMPSEYLGAGKVWAISSSPSGIMYMASDRGLLEFDGINWQRFRGSDGFLRSVLVQSDSLLYTGSDLDFGRWTLDESGSWRYTSLYPFRDELAGLTEEFWGVYEQLGYLYFVSASNLYVYRNQNLTKIAAPNRFSGSVFFEDALWLVDEVQGLMRVSEFSLQPVADMPGTGAQELVGMHRDGSDLILVTRNSGLLQLQNGVITPVSSPLAAELTEAGVFSYTTIGESHHAFGTVQRGLIIADTGGAVVHRIDRSKGLLNNTVLSLHHSPFGKLWLGLDFGLATLDLRSRFSFFYDYRGDFGTGYTALLKDEMFYLGTNTGFFRTPFENLHGSNLSPQLSLVPGLEGQVWSMNEIDGDILIGHDRGLFLYRDGQTRPLNSGRGVWTTIPYRDLLLAGTYNGISVFEKEDGDWQFARQMELILGSAAQLFPECEEWLWVNIPNFGIVRARLNEELFPVERQLFPFTDFEGDDLFLMAEGDTIVVVTSHYRYRFDAAAGAFVDKTPEHHIKLPGEMLPGFFQPISLNETWLFYPISNGFALKDLLREKATEKLNRNLLLRRGEMFSSEASKGWEPGITLPARLNNLRLEVLIPNENAVRYQYRLGSRSEWSVPQRSTVIELIGLRRGSHELQVQALYSGSVLAEKVLPIRVAPPWFLSWYALLIYVLLMVAGWAMLQRWHREILVEQKKALSQRKQKELKDQESKHKEQLLLLEQERLQEELAKMERSLKSKTLELANRAKKTHDKNKILLEIKEKTEALEATTQVSKSRITEIEKLIDACIDPDDNTFEIQMSELHQEFFRKMKELYPDLSGNDLRLCAYVKLGFSAKEIADMLHIQPSSVYISRSRLRKKLNLETDEDLYGFLNGIE